MEQRDADNGKIKTGTNKEKQPKKQTNTQNIG
jgi:hypothetical protein